MRSSSRMARSLIVVILPILLFPHAVNGQWPDGCSIPGGQEWSRRGLDALFLGACTAHDHCWATCNGEDPPYLDEGWMAWCNFVFYGHMMAACEIRANQPYPVDDIDNENEFLDYCQYVAALFAAAVSTPPAWTNFWGSQCTNGCNPDACDQIGLVLPYTCGMGSGYGACYSSSGTGGGDGGGDDDDWCDVDGDGWVTENECIFDCGGYVDEGYCNI